ncbi:MAG: IPT/TIG domain-containing protein, partial [Planctomycetes bacterium]|nr:IPT/TIG domain-containing protein [Planctomycetota bacterium]
MDEEMPQEDLKVEEISLDDLRDTAGEADETPKGPGVLRAGSLGPEGSRYRPVESEGRRSWKPLAAALVLFIGAFYGLFTIGYQLTLETRADGEFITIYGRVLDYDEAYDGNEVYIGGVNVTVNGMDLTRVTDDKGRFTYPDVPGGKFTISFSKRSWDEVINTTYVSILYTEIERDTPATFLVKITDLAPDRSRPVFDGEMEVLAEVMDWPNDSTVTLRVHATAFD